MQSVSKSPSQPVMLKPSAAQQVYTSREKIQGDNKSQKSRNDEFQVSKFKQITETGNVKEPMSATMTQQTPRLGNDEMKNQASGKKSAMQKLSLKKLEQS